MDEQGASMAEIWGEQKEVQVNSVLHLQCVSVMYVLKCGIKIELKPRCTQL